MTLEILLTTFGLDEKEARVYLASLELGTASVYEIAIKTGYKRPTTYLIVDELLKKGLVSLYKLKNKTYYTPLPPKKLFKRWESRLKQLENSLPELSKLESKSVFRPSVQFYEGIDGISSLYEELNPDPYHAEEMLFFGNISALEAILPERIAHWHQVIRDKRVIVKELLELNKENLTYAEKVSSYGLPHFEARFLKRDDRLGPIDCAIVGDRVYIISLIREYFGIRIQNRLVSEAFKTIYRMAWGMAS